MKLLFFCLSGSLAHAGRTVRLARALASRGHTCVLAGKPGFFADPQVLGRGEMQVETIAEPDIEEVLAAARGLPPKTPEYVRVDRMVGDERKLIDKVRPDVVVTDNRRSALVAAESRGVPSLSLANASLLGPHCAMEPRLEWMAKVCGPVMGGRPEQLLASPAYAGLAPNDPIALPSLQLGPAVEKVYARHGGRQRREFVHHLCFGDRTAILDPPSLMPTRNLPASARQSGPFFAELAAPLPSWWDSIDASKPLVYLTFGSTGRAGFAKAVEQLAAAGMQVAVTTAHLDKVPPMPNVLAARTLPARQMLERASVVICHGGTQTVYQSIACGTPVISMPSHLETAMTTIALVQANLGVTVAPVDVEADPRLLRRTVENVLADKALKNRVEAAARAMDENAALAAAVEAAESLAGKKQEQS